MRILITLLTCLIVTVWIVAIAILSVQNATPVVLRFLTFQSVQLPLGVLLAFCAGIGVIGMALLQPLWGLGESADFSEDEN